MNIVNCDFKEFVYGWELRLCQVHEELWKTISRVDQIQEQNSNRLEEISKLDTEAGSPIVDLFVSYC